MSRRLPQLMLALVALFGLIAIVVGVTSRSHKSRSSERTKPSGTDAAADDKVDSVTDTSNSGPTRLKDLPPAEEAKRSAQAFLERFVSADGKVTRDDAKDTVSEGQAYAMLMAVAVDDRNRFDAVWTWTKTNLLGPSGTLAWHWKDGVIIDANAATDADVDAARALALAADRFGVASYRADAVALSAAVLTENVVYTSAGPLLAPGPWARTTPYFANPSYIAPAAFAQLGDVSDDTRWPQLAASGIALLRGVTKEGNNLPPDWMIVDSGGTPLASSSPGGAAVAYSYDAFRTLPRLAEACDTSSRTLAASLWRTAQRTLDVAAERLNLDGTVQTRGTNPLFTLAAASAAHAAGEGDRSEQLLDDAEQLNAESPSYYLSSWLALTRLMLDTDLLGGCALEPTSTLIATTPATTANAITTTTRSQP
jgi:endoglucanase